MMTTADDNNTNARKIDSSGKVVVVVLFMLEHAGIIASFVVALSLLLPSIVPFCSLLLYRYSPSFNYLP